MSGTDARCCPSPSAAYKDFLTLWKDADSEIPIYKQAKAETRSWIRAKELRMKPLHRKFLQLAEFSNYNLSNLKPKIIRTREPRIKGNAEVGQRVLWQQPARGGRCNAVILVRQVVEAGLCENRTDFETPLHEDSLFPFTSVELASGNRRHLWIYQPS
jgi:hypothetical protein